jgi:hypothetical protein
MRNYKSKLRAFLLILSSVLCTSSYGAEYGRLIVPASSADPSSQAVILAEGETFTVLQYSTLRDGNGYVFVDKIPFELELFYDPTDYDNPEKMITFSGLTIGGIYYRSNGNSNGGPALTSSELSRTYVGPCKIRITKTVSDQDCYLAYKIIRKPSPSVSTEE